MIRLSLRAAGAVGGRQPERGAAGLLRYTGRGSTVKHAGFLDPVRREQPADRASLSFGCVSEIYQEAL